MKVGEIEVMVAELETKLAPVISILERMDGGGTGSNGGDDDPTVPSGPTIPGK